MLEVPDKRGEPYVGKWVATEIAADGHPVYVFFGDPEEEPLKLARSVCRGIIDQQKTGIVYDQNGVVITLLADTTVQIEFKGSKVLAYKKYVLALLKGD